MSRESTPQPKAIEVLKEIGALTRSSPQQSAVLGCLACRWKKNSEQAFDAMPHGFQIAQCTGIVAGSVYPILQRILRGEVMAKEEESIDTTASGRPARMYYLPIDTQRGEAFLESLEVPATCGLEETADSDDIIKRLPEILAVSSEQTVRWIMEAAEQELAIRNSIIDEG